jgi:nucleotide-binding universal stress UspA family protein
MSASASRHSPVVVVGFDDSSDAFGALAYAVARADRRGLVVVVHARESPADAPRPDDGAAGVALVARLPLPYGLRCSPVLRAGPAASVLAEVAAEFEADEIAVGRRGATHPHRGVGRVPLALLARTERPVVVVAAGAP